MKPRILLFAFMVLALGAGLYLVFARDQVAPDEPFEEQPIGGAAVPGEGDPAVPAPASPDEGQAGELGGRDEREAPARESDVDTAVYPQGVRGQVVSSLGGPVGDAKVYLLYGFDLGGMIQHLQRISQGRPPKARIAAEAKSDAEGRFLITAPASRTEAPYELRIHAEEYVVHSRQLRLTAEAKIDLGVIELERGRTLTGTVRDASTRSAVAGARVQVRLPESNLLVPTPGFEDGVEVLTKDDGSYRFRGLPLGPFGLKVLARGYATTAVSDVRFEEHETQKLQDLELAKGFEIVGWVTDARGKGVAGAEVKAATLSTAAEPPASVRTEDDGSFLLYGLSAGEFIVTAQAEGYVQDERKPVKAGQSDLHLVLEEQGKIRVRVLSHRGKPLANYRIEVLRYFEGQDSFGRTTLSPIEVRGAKGGVHLVAGIDPDSYVVQIDAIGATKTYSKPFKIVQGQVEPVAVDVTMNAGASISGQVVDESGNPVAAVGVFTRDSAWQDNPLFRMLQGLAHQRVSEASTTTGKDGRFSLAHLTPGKYQLQFDHPEFPKHAKRDLVLTDGANEAVGLVRLERGARVAGTVTYRGRPVQGAEVSITSSDTKITSPVFEKVFTDAKGEFRVPRPIPPGEYEVQACRSTVSNPFYKLADMQNSKQKLRLVAGASNRCTILIKG